MSTDLPVALGEIRAGRMRAREWLGSLRPPLATAIHAFDDPVPGAVDVPYLALLALRRRERAA